MVDRTLVLAHRGASRARLENTLAAFAKAREFGADGVELDVRRTADRQLVVHHDPEVEGFGLLIDQTFAALRSARPEIPTLREALEACAGMIVNVEIKCLPWEPDADTPDREVVRDVVALLRAAEFVAVDDIIVSSFDITAIDACRSMAPEIATGWLTSRLDVASGTKTAVEHGHPWLNPDHDAALGASSRDIDAAHKAGLRLNAWTIDDPAEIMQLVKAGFDAIISNTPDVAVEAVREPRR